MKVTILDTEFTHCKVDYSITQVKRIFQIALLEYDLDSNQITNRYESYINPECQISDIVVSKLNLNRSVLSKIYNSQPLDNHYTNISPFLNNVLVAHNFATADYWALKNHLNYINKDLNVVKYFCTMSNASLLNTKSRKLNDLCYNFGIQIDNHHNAIDDTYACLELLKLYNQKYDISKLIKIK